MGNLLDHFKTSDTETKGTLTAEEFKQALTSFYPTKDEEWVAQLMSIAETELAVNEETPFFEFERLFMSVSGMFSFIFGLFLREEK